MGVFDDLIPQQQPQRGMFDDLVPVTPQVTPAMPADPMMGAEMPPAPVVPGPQQMLPTPSMAIPGTPDAPIMTVPETPVPNIDESSALGDLTAGWLQMQQFFPGRQVMSGTRDIMSGEHRAAQTQAFGSELDQLNAQIAEIEATLAAPRTRETRLDPQVRRDMEAQMLELSQRRGQLQLALGAGGVEASMAEAQGEREAGAQAVTQGALRIGELNDQIAQIPMNPAAARGFGPEASWGDVGQAILDDPYGVFRTFGLRSLPASAPTIGAAVVGQLVGGPGAAAAAAGGTTYQTEQALSIANEISGIMAQSGIDTSNPDAVGAYIAANPQMFSEMLSDAMVRAGIISTADALTAGLVGRVATATSGMGRGARVATAAGTGTLVEPLGEAGGEAAAQLATTGEIQPGEVAAEAIGGLALGGPTAVAQTVAEANRTPGRVLGREFGRMVDETQLDATLPTITTEAAPVAPQAAPQAPVQPTPDPAPVAPAAPPDVPAAPRAPRQPEEPEPEASPAAPAPEQPGPTGAAPAAPEAPEVPAAPQAPANPERRMTVYTPDDEPVEVDVAVVEADELLTSDQEGYPAELQPRDRDRAASQAQIERIANAPNPARLDATAPETDRGAPIVGQDGRVVESGNGRIMGLRRAYERGTAEAYRAYIAERYPEAANMRNPVLVRRRVSDVNEQDFTVASNTNAGLEMSATEVARADARKIDDDVLANYRGGEIGAASNRDMVRSFISKLPQSAQGALITKEGGLTVDGQRRFQNALFSRAYGDDRLLTRVAESPDDDMRSVSNALITAAPRVAQMRNAIERGEVSPDVDFTEDLRKALENISNMRARGQNLVDYRAQQDAFAEPDSPLTEAIMDAFFNEQGTRLVSKKRMQDFLDQFVTEAMEQKIDQASLPGVEAPPIKSAEEIARGLTENTTDEGDGETLSLFDPTDAQPERTAGRQGVDRPRQEAQRPAVDRDRKPASETQTLKDAEKLGRQPKGSLSPSFMAFSFNNRPSVFATAFKDAGIDPDEARMMDPDKQLRVLVPMVEQKFGLKVQLPEIKVRKRNVVGRKTTETRTGITSREAIDQLLDAYQNLQMMASVLGVPTRALGLEIDGTPVTLSLVGRRQLGALGMYSYTGDGGKRTIHLPGRSNSFAHEWAHALDHYLNRVVNPKDVTGMLTRTMDSKGVTPPLSPNYRLTDAFAHMMWSMFGDRSQLAALTLRLQVESAQLNAEGKPTPKAKQAQKILTDMRAGKRPPEQYLSRYFKTSKQFDDMVSAGGYFTDPAEMFARAFETHIGRTVASLTDLPQSFLTKGGWAYADDATEARAELTFPKGTDAYQFGVAVQGLSQAMMQLKLFGQEPTATRPSEDGVYTDRAMLTLQRDNRPILERELEALGDSGRKVKSLLFGSTGRNLRTGFGQGLTRFYQHKIDSTASVLWGTAWKQTNPTARKALENVARRVAKMPGSGQETGRLWQEEFEVKTRQRINRINNFVKEAYPSGKMPEADRRVLKAMLNGRGAPANTPVKLKTLGARLRKIMDEMWYDMRDVGVELNYEAGYLPHIYDPSLIDANPAAQRKFRRQAAKVYELMFEREVTNNPDDETQIADINSLLRQLKNKKRANPDGTLRSVSYLTDELAEVVDNWRKARRKLNDMERRLAKSDSPDDGDKLAAIEAQAEQVQELKAELLAELQPLFGEVSAEEWYSKIHSGALTDTPSFGPTSSILESRKLPKEASQFLEDFMVADPLELITGHVYEATRLAEYARLFGAKSEKLDAMLTAAGNAGATKYDLEVVKEAVNGIVGRVAPANTGAQIFNNVAFVWGSLALLGNVIWSSFAEPSVAGFRTGKASYGVRALAGNLTGWMRRGNQRQLKELSMTIGLITDGMNETIASNRLGSDAANMSKATQELLAKFFERSLATPLYNYQRRTMLPLAHHFIRELLRENVAGKKRLTSRVRDAFYGQDRSYADGELKELGILGDDREALLDWIEGLNGLPRENDLFAPDGSFNPAAELWIRATTRFIDETIQNPQKADRPIAANNPTFSGIYAIQSFIMSFHRNALRRTLLRGTGPDDSMARRIKLMGVNTALAAPAVTILFTAIVAQEIIRTMVTDPGKFDEWEEDEDRDIETEILRRAFSRSGLTGRWDALVQLYTGVKYETDITSAMVGAYKSAAAGEAQDILAAFNGRNSGNTNTAEHDAAEAFYNLLVKPTLLAGVTQLWPQTGALRYGGTAAMGYFSRWGTGSDFADFLVDERGTRYRGDPPWFELSE